MHCINVPYYASFVEIMCVICNGARLWAATRHSSPLVIVVVFALPWRRWSLDEGEAAVALDHH